MGTTSYFEETITDQGGKESMKVQFGRSSFYANCDTPVGKGEDSIYLTVDGKSVLMSRAMAQKFVDAVLSVGQYHNLV